MTIQSRFRALERLVKLYSAVETMHSIELQRTTAALRDVRQSIVAQQEVDEVSRTMSCTALQQGNHIGWHGARTEQEAALWRRGLLEKDRLEWAVLQDAAMEQYVTSRIKAEQMKRLREDIAHGIEAEAGRHAQAASDDRFLARRRWKDHQEQCRFRT